MDRAQVVRLIDPKANEFEKIGLTDLQGLLAFDKRVRFCTLITRTVPDMRKKSNPFWGNLFKIARINVMINPHDEAYSHAVNAQRKREGGLPDFIAQKRAWGTRLSGIPFVAHITREGKAKFYLEVFKRRDFREIYQDGQGNILDPNLVRPYLVPKRQPMTQQTRRPIELRDFDINHLIGVSINKKRYLVE